jgi:hypothetical protein
MSQDEVSRLSEAIERLADTFHVFEVNFAALNAKREERIERLERSDSEQWKIIRDTQTKIMRYVFFVTGAVTVLASLGILDKVRVLLTGP